MIGVNNDLLNRSDLLVNATLNGIYQGIIVAALVAITLRLLPRTNAATRHAVWFFTLFLIVSIIPAHFFYNALLPNPEQNPGTQPRVELPDVAAGPAAIIISATAPSGHSNLAPVEDSLEENFGSNVQGEDDPVQGLTGAGAGGMQPSSNDKASISLLSIDSNAPIPSTAELGRSKALVVRQPHNFWTGLIPSAATVPISWNFLPGSKAQRQAALVLLGVWATVAGIRLMLLVFRVYQIRRFKCASLSPGKELEQLFRNLCAESPLNRAVSLRISASQRSAALLGFFHPMIVLPAESSEIAGGDTENIMRHELAHARRRDDWANLFQQGIQAAFFFHPAVWWISKQVSLEREIACDDCVLHHAGQRRSYALLLANLAGRLNRPPLALAPGVSTKKSQLQQRINMILNTQRNTSPRLAKSRLGIVASVAALLTGLILYLAPRIVLAVPPPARAALNQSVDQPTPEAEVSQTEETEPSETESSDAVAAEPTLAPAAPVAIDPGPKFKPGPGEDLPRPTIAPFPATPALPPVAALTPAPSPFQPEVPETPHPVALPRHPRSPDGLDKDSSIEDRLDRLEQMVHSLMAERHAGHPGHVDWHEGQIINEKEIARIKEEAMREAAHAGEEARRAAREIQRAFADKKMRPMEEEFKIDAHNFARNHEAMAQQMEALKRQREILQRQMEKLQNQLERLERQRDKVKEQKESEEEPDPKDAPAPPKK